jgi:ATP-dependent DNA helicase RecG
MGCQAANMDDLRAVRLHLLKGAFRLDRRLLANVFTEKRVYPYVREDDLRFDMLPRVRRTAVNSRPVHPWKDLGDAELLKSAWLFGEDKATGEKGYNLAAVVLLGHDEVIRSILPAYCTDAITRKVNLDRYDDRLLVATNLIDSYERLMGFAEKHLLDKFYLEDDTRVSLRGKITREMLVNTLIHREFTSPYIAKFIIEKDRMYVENANRAAKGGVVTLENYEPNPKNPIIASFFRNIGLADELGSGVRNLYKYGRRYSGGDPELIDGDVFRIIVPLDDGYSFDAEIFKVQIKGSGHTINCNISESEIAAAIDTARRGEYARKRLGLLCDDTTHADISE